MATGVLVIGVETGRPGCLGYLALTDKAYEATIRLGHGHGHRRRRGRGDREPSGAPDLTDARIEAALAALRGEHPPGAVRGVGDQGRRGPLLRPGAGRPGRSSLPPGP